MPSNFEVFECLAQRDPADFQAHCELLLWNSVTWFQFAAEDDTDQGIGNLVGEPNKTPNLGFSGNWGGINSSYYPWWAHHNIAAWTKSPSKTVGSHSLKFGWYPSKAEPRAKSLVVGIHQAAGNATTDVHNLVRSRASAALDSSPSHKTVTALEGS
jgi:hypothetical protein